MRTLLVFVLTVSGLVGTFVDAARADEEVGMRDQIPEELVTKIRDVIAPTSPNEISVTERPSSVQLQYHCREYVVYGVYRPVAVSPYPQVRSGPMHDGIDVQLTWKDSGAEYLARGGMDGGAHFGQVRATCYWREYVNLWRLPNEGGVVELKCQFGEKVDMEVLSTLRKELSQMGEEVFEARPNWWTARPTTRLSTSARFTATRLRLSLKR